MSRSFSPQLDQVLQTLRFTTNGRASYPRGLQADPRCNSSDVVSWFRTVVDNFCDGDVAYCEVEDSLALFVIIRVNGQEITYANCQAVVSIGGTLADLYLGAPDIKAHYYRMDFDLLALGPAFKEPQPHVHVYPDGAPRFPCPTTTTCVVDFFDFIYRNYYEHLWFEWASNQELGAVRFNLVDQAFREGKYRLLATSLRDDVVGARARLRAISSQWLPYRVSDDIVQLLNYLAV